MINTLTINPAIDRQLYLPAFKRKVTNRVVSSVDAIGGKGTHVSINLQQMGLSSCAFGVICGMTGQRIEAMLKEYGVQTCFVDRGQGESRTNYILVENDASCTTIAEKGPMLTDDDIRMLTNKMLAEIKDGEFLVLSGDASNCESPDIYGQIVLTLHERHPKVFLDASGETLRRGLAFTPYLIKPNRDELEALCGLEMNTDADVVSGIRSLDAWGIEVIAVSLGERGSIVRIHDHFYRVDAPAVQTKNTNGCGDSYLAGLLYGLQKKLSDEDMLRFACAVSSATAASPSTVGYDSALANRLIDEVVIERM